jgi:hypothetical protein
MPRWYILRVLAKKEVLRYRYNWGLLVLVFALLALSFLLSVSSRMSILPGQADSIRNCAILFQSDSPFASQWAGYLQSQEPPLGKSIMILPTSSNNLKARRDAVWVELPATDASPLLVRYGYYDGGVVGLLTCRDWFTTQSSKYLKASPQMIEQSSQAASRDTTPFIFTGILVFTLYILAFNLFVTSTGEEREKKILLALLLSPASSSELMLAKSIFYCGASFFVSGLIVLMYKPILLLQPLLWATVLMGALGYLSVGIIALSLIRRQTTLSTVSILYMLITTVITFLGSFQPLFFMLKYFFLEDYIYRQFFQLFSNGVFPAWWLVPQAILTVGWMFVALVLFRRRGIAVSQ